MKLDTEVGIGVRQNVLNGDPAASPKRAHAAPSHQKKFGHVCCGETAGWIKMQLGTDVGLSPGHTVLGDPAPLPKGAQPPPNFGPCLL